MSEISALAELLAEHGEDGYYPDTCVCEVEIPDYLDGHYAAHIAAAVLASDWLAEVRRTAAKEAGERARVMRAAVEQLADSIHGDSGWEHNSGCEGEPDCFACIEADLRRIAREEGRADV